jgi:hypothetical protein
MPKYKPNFLLDEQMLFSDAKTTLAFQIREEIKETNHLLKKLVEQGENKQTAAETPDATKEDLTKIEDPHAKDENPKKEKLDKTKSEK